MYRSVLAGNRPQRVFTYPCTCVHIHKQYIYMSNYMYKSIELHLCTNRTSWTYMSNFMYIHVELLVHTCRTSCTCQTSSTSLTLCACRNTCSCRSSCTCRTSSTWCPCDIMLHVVKIRAVELDTFVQKVALRVLCITFPFVVAFCTSVIHLKWLRVGCMGRWHTHFLVFPCPSSPIQWKSRNRFSYDWSRTGLPDFSWYMIPKTEKCTKWIQNVPMDHKIFQISIKFSKWP
jgi:hypothetical protein